MYIRMFDYIACWVFIISSGKKEFYILFSDDLLCVIKYLELHNGSELSLCSCCSWLPISNTKYLL